MELVGLVKIRVDFLGPGEAPGALLETFEDNPVERDGREDAAISASVQSLLTPSSMLRLVKMNLLSVKPGCRDRGSPPGPTTAVLRGISLQPARSPGHRRLPAGRFRQGSHPGHRGFRRSGPFVRKPRTDVALPAVGKFVLALQPPGGVLEVLEGCVKFSLE